MKKNILIFFDDKEYKFLIDGCEKTIENIIMKDNGNREGTIVFYILIGLNKYIIGEKKEGIVIINNQIITEEKEGCFYITVKGKNNKLHLVEGDLFMDLEQYLIN